MQFSTNRISVSRPLAVFVMSMMLMVSPLGRPALAGHYPGAISLTSGTYNSSNNTTTYTWTLTGQGGSASHVVINTCLGNTAISTGGSPDSQATYTNPDSTTGKTGYKWESGSDLVTGDTFILTFSGNTGTSGTATWTIKKGSDSAHFNSGNTGGPSCSTPPPPTSVTASASPGACVFTNGVSFTPVTASINPAGGATVALSKAGVLVHTFPTSGTSYNASPGTYTWVATAASGYVLSGTSTGGFTALACASSDLVPVSVSVSPGACVFTNGVSFTPVTASINPAGGATVALSKAGVLVHTFPTSGTSYNASPGTYTWVATAASGYVLSGTSTGGFTALACASSDLVPVSVSVSPGACVLANGVSSTPVTASINPAGGATVELIKDGTGLVHTFPTSGATYNASPGNYLWRPIVASGYVLSGTSGGGFVAASCTLVLSQTFTSQPVSVLGVKVVKGQAVKGQTLPNTGPGVPVDNSLALAFASILVGLLLSYAGRRKAVAARQ